MSVTVIIIQSHLILSFYKVLFPKASWCHDLIQLSPLLNIVSSFQVENTYPWHRTYLPKTLEIGK